MNLQHIKEERCPTCGAIATQETRSSRMHTNGSREELRRFACQRTLRYMPNYSRVEVLVECRHHPDTINAREKHNEAVKTINDTIDKLDMPPKWKSDLRNAAGMYLHPIIVSGDNGW